MVFGSKSDYDTMLQIVPSAGFSPPPSNEYNSNYATDNFDLSLLPAGMDPEISFPTATNNVQQILSLYYDVNSPPPIFPVYDGMTKESAVDPFAKTPNLYDDAFAKDSVDFLDKCNNNNNTWSVKDSNDFLNKQFKVKEDTNKNAFLDMEITEWEPKNDWDNMRVQSSVSSTHSATSSSSCSSPSFQLCPSPPTEFESFLPLEEIKQERLTQHLQSLLADSEAQKCEPKKPELLRSILEKSPLNENKTAAELAKSTLTDKHQLMRELLKDDSFQKKYNLRAIDIEGLGTAFASEIKSEDGGKIALKEDVVCDVNLAEGFIPSMLLTKAIDQLMQDVDNTCIILGIPRDPKKWSVEDVRNWVEWNSKQFNFPIIMELFNVTGAVLTTMSEQDFVQRTPQCGNILYAQLEIWKMSGSMESTHLHVSNLACDTNTQVSSCIEVSDDEDEDAMTDTSSNCSSGMQSGSVKMTGRGSGSHIHLWQFLKELLSSPQAHGSCIRWLDRGKGVFKIEDSVRVARLWGKRKNRPAMNYDKLSRSIRQYYKKGIMKKTERSQRLVYQFCTPYNL